MAEMKSKSREEIIQQDMRDLHKLGYAQQLFREMGGFSNFAISFSIISILTGAILLFGYGLGFADPSSTPTAGHRKFLRLVRRRLNG